ncbi:MAG: hypothetical protein KM310_00790 [Clostridiales bacterium]|nr:hypothetical protein [Clostridiales bacterium]
MRLFYKGLAAAVLSTSLLLPVIPAFAQGNALGDLLAVVDPLVESTEINAQAKAGIQTADGVRVTAVAATKETVGGLAGVMSSLLGGARRPEPA